MSEKKRPNRTSDEASKKKQVDGKEGLERLADLTRRILKAGKVSKHAVK